MKQKRRSKKRIYIIGIASVSAVLITYLSWAIIPQSHQEYSVIATPKQDRLSIENYHRFAITTTLRLIDEFHYVNRPLDNDLSKEILDNYLNALDFQKKYFRQSDIDEFAQHQKYMDDYLRKGELDVVFQIFKRYQDRVLDRMQFAKQLLDYPFDFELNEEFETDRSDANWFDSQIEYDAYWIRSVKNSIITESLINPEFSQVQDTLFARFRQTQRSVSLYKADDVVELYLNSYLTELDPYSNYFSPHSSDNLEISISQQIEGIGAMLKNESEAIVIHSVIAGGPAARSQQIHAGDRIIAVGKDENDNYLDVIGWRLGDVVDLIRGPKGTAVYLKIIPNGALIGESPLEVAIIREKIKLEERIPRVSTIDLGVNGTVLLLAVIDLPAFYSELYSDQDGEHQRTSSNDVKELLVKLNEQNVDGIVLDLRGNGGGALNEAVNLTSLFIENGPVVQTENSKASVKVYSDTDGQVAFDEPIVVLVDRGSASASEIFAAAIQDYRRGIIVGETTYGKGTLQAIWPFTRRVEKGSAGSIKLSTARFYRVNGLSTQQAGVTPDILFKTDQFVSNTGEQLLENSIPSGVIDPVQRFTRWQDANQYENRLPELQQRSTERTDLHPVLNYYVERERQTRKRRADTKVHLNQQERRASLEKNKKIQLDLINELRVALGLEPVTELNHEAFPIARAGMPN